MNNLLSDINEKHGQAIRTIFCVIVTPILVGISIFFLKETYNEQKQVQKTQNEILVELGKISSNNNHLVIKLNDIKSDNEKEFSKHLVMINNNNESLIDIWKSLNKQK